MSRKLSIILLSLIFTSSVASINLDSSRESAKQAAFYDEQEISRANGDITFAGPYCFPDRHPEVLKWISVFSCFALLFSIFSANKYGLVLLSAIPLAIFAYWYSDTKVAMELNESTIVEGFDRFLYRWNSFDIAVLSLLLLSILIQAFGIIRNLFHQPIVRQV